MSHPAWSIVKSFYCINLEQNTKRWEDCIPQFIFAGIDYVEQVKTVESPENRYISFNHAHYDTIKKGYETGEPFCIFEDDIVFDRDWKRLEEASIQLPDNWDMLFIGANIVGVDTTEWQMPTKISGNLARLYNAWQTHSIIYSNKGAKWILDNFDPDKFPVYDEWLRMGYEPEHVSAMRNKNVYCTIPLICYQRPGYSDVWRTDTEYGCHKPGNKYLLNL